MAPKPEVVGSTPAARTTSKQGVSAYFLQNN